MHRSTGSPPGARAAEVGAGAPAGPVELDRLEQALTRAEAIDLDRVHPDELADLVRRVKRLEARTRALAMRTIGVFDRRRGYQADGARSASDWIAGQLRVPRREAHREVRLARSLPSLPATRAAVEDGRISTAHAEVITRTVEDPDSVAGRRLEAELLDAAGHCDPHQLARDARRRRIQSDPQGAAETARRQWDARCASRTEAPDGMVTWRVVSDPASAEYLDAAIQRLSRPDPTDLPEDQRRHVGQRHHDAFLTLARAALDRDELPARHGPSTTGMVVIDLHTLSSGDGDARPPAELATNGPIDAATARSLVCDAAIGRVVFAGASQPLDLGRSRRLFTDAQRAAIYARDRGCRRCGAALATCEIHHLREWEDGGRTDLANGIALCAPCHRTVHLAGWSIVLHADTTAEFTRGGRRIVRPPPRGP